MITEYIERDEPLARCPDSFCRRIGLCRNGPLGQPCLRTHEDKDDFRDRLSAKLRALAHAHGLHLLPPPTLKQQQMGLAALKRALEQREAEIDAEERR